MKGKFELAITFECKTQEQFDEIGKMLLGRHLSAQVLFTPVIKLTDLTNSKGDKVIGNFNPTNDPFINDIKEVYARLYNMLESIEVDSREKAMFKTSAQMHLVDSKMEAVNIKFL